MASPKRKTKRIGWLVPARQLLGGVLLWIGVYACLRFGGFSLSQSLTLILLFTLFGVVEMAITKRNTPPPFEPLVIEIWPHMKLLLADYSLLDETKWHTVTGSGKSEEGVDEEVRKTWSGRFPPVFTVLSPSLYYSHNHHSFRTQLKDAIDLRSVCLDTTHHGFLQAPAFYLREKRNSGADVPELVEILEFGLMLSEGRGMKELPLASLPKAIVDRGGVTANLDTTLHDSGWKREWVGGDDPDVEEEDVVEVLTHRYVTVHVQQV
jgi:hypothetical protein